MNDTPTRISILSAFNDALDKILVWISIAIGVVLTINMIVAVFFRYVLSSPIFWADDLSLYLFCWITFLGAGLAVKRSDMASVTFIVDRLPKQGRVLLAIVNQVTILLFAVIIGYYSILWIKSPSVMNQVAPALSVKVWRLYTIIPASMLCITLFSIEHTIRIAAGFARGNKKEATP